MGKLMQEKVNISLVQPGFDVGPDHLDIYYLPYTIGLLWAYAKQNKKVEDNFNVEEIIFNRDPYKQNFDKIKNSKIIFFSAYVWNWKISLRLAEDVKKHNPDALCVFGGPNIPHTDKDLFLKYPQIDSIAIGEGEQVFEDILLSYLENEELQKIYRAERIKDLKIPSPYLDGIFDDIMAENPHIIWNPTLEIDRGCPYKCTFCDWGGLTNAKVYKFELDRVFAELEWMSKHGCDFISCTAANFGIFKERDMMIAEKMADLHQKEGVIKKFQTSFAKNSNANILQIIKFLNENGVNSQFIISLQTFTDQVLENIERKNMKITNAEDITAFANKHHMPMGTELILGLPGETLETWKESMGELYKHGFHTSLDIYSLQVIENAPMNDQRELFGLDTFSAHDMVVDVTKFEADDQSAESVEVIKSTNTMSQKELIEAYCYTSQVISLHNTGICDIIAIYCYKKLGISYRDFYAEMLEYLKDDFQEWKEAIEKSLYQWHNTGNFAGWVGEKIGAGSDIKAPQGSKIYSWAIPYIMPMEIHFNQKVPYFMDKIADYLLAKGEIDPVILEDYRHISKNRVKYWGNYIYEQKEMTTKTNLYDYTFAGEEELEYGDFEYTIDDQYYREYAENIVEHTNYILYGRQRRWHLHKVNKKDK